MVAFMTVVMATEALMRSLDFFFLLFSLGATNPRRRGFEKNLTDPPGRENECLALI